jgi:NhaA family Na+:H+ antiporter
MSAQRRITSIAGNLQTTFQDFFSSSTAGGIIILVFTAVAMLWINSPWSESYEHLIHAPVNIQLFSLDLKFSFAHFVNDALMVIFFVAVGLEIKRELLVGELSSRKRALLPMIAAVFGMVGPALIYLAFNGGTDAARGWGTPVATDIAFALGVLALVGPRVPLGIKVFLAALAIVDDLLSVLVIALFYSSSLNVEMLMWSGIVTAILFAGNRLGVYSIKFYVLGGLALWVCVLSSGIHATIAGVVLAMTIPARRKLNGPEFFAKARALMDEVLRRPDVDDDEATQMDAVHDLEKLAEGVQTPLHRIEHALQPYVAFVIMPIFALVNAGVAIDASLLGGLLSPVSLGIALGLFIGKQLGISAAVWASVRLGIADLPQGSTMKQIYGVSLLCGIGFTMALFVANLAFLDPAHLNEAKLAILLGSTISAIAGSIVLRRSLTAPLPTSAI